MPTRSIWRKTRKINWN